MPSPHPVELFIPEIKLFIKENRLEDLKELLSEINPIDLADGFNHFPSEEQILLIRLMDPHRALEVFEELDTPQQKHILGQLDDECIGKFLKGITEEVYNKCFEKFPDRSIKRMQQIMKKGRLGIIRNEKEYPPNTAGSLMQTEFITVRPESTARHTLQRLQATARVRRGILLHSLYAANENRKLLGRMTLRTLISAPADIKIKDIMSPVGLIKILATADQEEAAKVFAKYKLNSAPVVDEDNLLIGILTANDIISVIQEEATEDIALLAGTKAEELETGSFLRVTALRMPWLLASYLGGIVAFLIIGYFENLLSQVVALASFIPVIAGMGGNVGTQSSTIVVRGLATGRIQMNEIFRVIRREFAVGLTLGIIYGVLLSLIANIQHGDRYTWLFPLVVGSGILTSMTVAATMGTLTPIVFKKMNIDPAAVSAPFVSTITDIASISVYFFLATAFLL